MEQATVISVHSEPSEHMTPSAFDRHAVGLPAGERRHSFRVRVPGRASIWRKEQLRGHYGIVDLCLQGCSLCGLPQLRSHAQSPASTCARGEHVELVLHLQNCPDIWLTAEVRRAQGGMLGLCFDRCPARVEDRLQDLVVEAYARDHMSTRYALVIEPRAALRHALVRKLEAVGQRALGAATPLDAMQLLMDGGASVDSALIGPQPDGTPNVAFAEFLALAHPRVHRVLMGDAEQLSESWLAEATGDVDALLETPCSEEALRKLIKRVSAVAREPAS
jgi:hypothetical protein